MTLACPACGAKLAASSIRNHFACPQCAVKLRGKTTWPSVIGIALWCVLDMVIRLLAYSTLGDTLTAHLVFYGLSGCIGFSLVFALIGEFGVVTVDDAESN